MVLPSVLVMRPLIIAIVRPTCRTVLWIWIFVPRRVSKGRADWESFRGKKVEDTRGRPWSGMGIRDKGWGWGWNRMKRGGAEGHFDEEVGRTDRNSL
jgi:hypothetical protein